MCLLQVPYNSAPQRGREIRVKIPTNVIECKYVRKKLWIFTVLISSYALANLGWLWVYRPFHGKIRNDMLYNTRFMTLLYVFSLGEDKTNLIKWYRKALCINVNSIQIFYTSWWTGLRTSLSSAEWNLCYPTANMA